MNIFTTLLIGLAGLTIQEKSEVFNPHDGEYNVVTGVCLEQAMKETSSYPVPMFKEIKDRLLNSVSLEGYRMTFRLGAGRWPCDVLEVYRRVEALNFEELKKRIEAPSNIAHFWVLQLEEVDARACGAEDQKKINKFYEDKLGKERAYIKFQNYLLDTVHSNNRLALDYELERYLTESEDRESDLYSLTLLDEEWFKKEKLGSRGLGRGGSLRLGTGLKVCGPVTELVLSHQRKMPILDDVPKGTFRRKMALCESGPVPQAQHDEITLPFPLKITFREQGEIEVEVEKNQCRVQLTYDRSKARPLRQKLGALSLALDAILLKTKPISCATRQSASDVAANYDGLYMTFSQLPNAYSQWRFGQLLGVRLGDPTRAWFLEMNDFEDQFSCDGARLGVYYEFTPEAEQNRGK
jgi:hypothetical protein